MTPMYRAEQQLLVGAAGRTAHDRNPALTLRRPAVGCRALGQLGLRRHPRKPLPLSRRGTSRLPVTPTVLRSTATACAPTSLAPAI